jgi:hypothetical protein
MTGLGFSALQKKFFPKADYSNTSMPVILIIILILPVSNLLLDIGGKSVGYFLVLYLLGYYLLSEDTVIERLSRYKAVLAAVAVLFSILCVYFFIWTVKPVEVLWKSAMFLSCWFGILALLGIGKRYFNQNNRITWYLSSRSYTIYFSFCVGRSDSVLCIQNYTKYISNICIVCCWRICSHYDYM